MAFVTFIFLFFLRVFWSPEPDGFYMALKKGWEHVTHTLPGFAVGWEFLLLLRSVFWASAQLQGSGHARQGRNEEALHLPPAQGAQQSFREQTGEGGKSSTHQKYYSGLVVVVVFMELPGWR